MFAGVETMSLEHDAPAWLLAKGKLVTVKRAVH